MRLKHVLSFCAAVGIGVYACPSLEAQTITVNSYPSSASHGESYTISWTLSGFTNVTHTNVHWGTTSASQTTYGASRIGNGFHSNTLTAPSSGTAVYFKIHVVATGFNGTSALHFIGLSAPATITVGSYPSSVAPGASYNISWTLSGYGNVTHTNVHWGTSSGSYPSTGATRSGGGAHTNTLTAPTTGSRIYFVIHVVHASGNFFTSEYTIDLSEPASVQVTGAPILVNAGQSYTVTWSVSGFSNVTHTNVHWSTTSGTHNLYSTPAGVGNGMHSATLTAPTTGAGIYYIIHVRHGGGSDYTQERAITVLSNGAPVLTASRGASVVEAESLDPETFQFTVTASDPEGDALGPVSVKHLVNGSESSVLPAGMSLNGSTFSFQTNDSNAGSYTMRFRVSETRAGGATTILDVVITIENELLVKTYPGGTVTFYLENGVDIVSPHDVRSGNTTGMIDVLFISEGYDSVGSVSTDFVSGADSAANSIHAIEPFKSARSEFNYWRIHVVRAVQSNGVDMTGDLIRSSINLWDIGGEADAVDFILTIRNVPAGQDFRSFAHPWSQTAVIERSGAYQAAGHEFGHIFTTSYPENLDDEYDEYINRLEARSGGRLVHIHEDGSETDTYLNYRDDGWTHLLMRAVGANAGGTCSFTVSPIPQAWNSPGHVPVQVDTDGDGQVDSLRWDDLPYDTLAGFKESWHPPEYSGTNQWYNGSYGRVLVLLRKVQTGVFDGQYTFRAFNFQSVGGGSVPQIRVAVKHQSNVDSPKPNLTTIVGGKWGAFLGLEDPSIPGQVINWYEHAENVRYVPTASGCQMRVAGQAPFCLVCRSFLDQVINLPAVRDDIRN